MILLQNVIESYDNSIKPDKEVVDKINGLVKIVPKNELIKRELIHIINIISESNKKKCLAKFQQIVNLHWKDEFDEMFFLLLKNTNITNIDVLIDMFNCLTTSNKNNIINLIYDSNLVNIEMKICGTFLGKYYSSNNSNYSDIQDKLENETNYKPHMIIHIFITLILNEKYDILYNNIIDKIKKMNINTSTRMLLYDLEDLCTEKGILKT